MNKLKICRLVNASLIYLLLMAAVRAAKGGLFSKAPRYDGTRA